MYKFNIFEDHLILFFDNEIATATADTIINIKLDITHGTKIE